MKQFGILALGSRLKRLSDYLFAEVQQIYVRRNIPISSTYFPILRLLQHNGGLSVMEVAEQLGVSHPAVSKQVAKMIKDGLLIKEGDNSDQRRSLLRLSSKGTEAMKQVEPVLAEIKRTLEGVTEFAGEASFLPILTAVEERILKGGFSDAVLQNLTKAAYAVVPYRDDYRDAFKALNLAWLEKYFPAQITEYDYQVLNEPEKQVLDRGGNIWFAVCKEHGLAHPVGTIALKPVNATEYAIIKLAVDPGYQRQGIATLLLNRAIACAGKNGADVVSLETASLLASALRLYHRLGFVEQRSSRLPSVDRADMYMVLQLTPQTIVSFGDLQC